MHKILIQTELPRLRNLGFEVFCPPYRANSSQHQSAANGWTCDQVTTLPKNVFKFLSSYNFFYQELSPKIMQLLNQYFDVVIVTIDPAWLTEILRGYNGKIIYRTYGHVELMSKFLRNQNAMRALVEKDNFWYVPHSSEAAHFEDSWLTDRMEVVPYCVTNDVLKIKDQWQPSRKEIMISCPNIANPHYRKHFEYLKTHFADSMFKFYGVQTSATLDPQLVGTISFEELLSAYTQSAGFLYTYTEATVCFLPPIEMMIAGGPTIFMAGSLLDHYFQETNPPGRAKCEVEARLKCQKLLDGDTEFIQSILESQRAVRKRYLPENVWPHFDRTFLMLLNPNTKNFGLTCLSESFLEKKTSQKFVLADATQDLGTLPTHDKKDGYTIVLCYRDKVFFLWNLFKNKKNLVFYPIDAPISKKIDTVLYSADPDKNKLVFVATHPKWLTLKVLSIIHRQFHRLGSCFQKKPKASKSRLKRLEGLVDLAAYE